MRGAVGDGLPWRALATTAFLPNLLASLGVAAVLPLLPGMAIELGASLAASVFVVAALTIGQLAGSVLGGALVIRVGDRRSMIIAAVLGTAGGLLGIAADSVVALIVASLVIGMSVSALALARHAFVTVSVPIGQRGRTMSMMAGCSKVGQLIGPFAMVLLLGLGAPSRASFALVSAVSVAVALMIAMSKSFGDERSASRERTDGTWAAARQHSRPLAVVGTGAALLGMLRISRQVLIPVWGVSIGLSASSIALIIGCSSALDVALFYLGGSLMDRYGRLQIAVPALLAFAVAHACMALVGVAPNGVLLLTLVAFAMAIANAMTSGVIASLGSDLADPRQPAGFLSAWRLITESGPAATPIVIAVTAAVSLGFASLVMAGIALLAAVLLGFKAGPYLPPVTGGRPRPPNL